MFKHNSRSLLLPALLLSFFGSACSSSEQDRDNDRRALEREALEREIETAIQVDTTDIFELGDAAIIGSDSPAVIIPTPSVQQPNVPAQRPTQTRPRIPPSQVEPQDTRPWIPAETPRLEVSRTAAAGSVLMARLDQDISTESSPAGTTFTATLTSDVRGSNGEVVLPAGSVLHGRVNESRASGSAGESPLLVIDFTSITVDGERHSFDGTLESVTPRRVNRASNTETAAKIGAGAAAGAIIGRVIGKSTKSTVAGAAIGAAAGTAVAMGTADVDLVLPAGTTLRLTLDSPLRVN